MTRLLWQMLIYINLALAAAGAVLPGLPCTVFVLIALWAASHGHPEWVARIEAHPRYGAVVRDWRSHRAIPRKAKCLACCSMLGSWLILLASGASTNLMAGLGLMFFLIAAWLCSRPEAAQLTRGVRSPG